jgi:hypothetical protein
MTPVSTLPRLRTPGVIARELGETLQRVQYVLRTRPHIKPRPWPADCGCTTVERSRWYATS